MVLCVKGRQQRGLTLPLQIETKPQKRKTRFASNSVESIPARGWPQIYEWFHSLHVSPTCRADGYTDSMKLARLKNLSGRASGKDQTCGLIFFFSRRVCVWQRLRIHTHTSASPVYPLLHAPSIRPWNNSSVCLPQKNLIHKQQNIQAPIIWQTDPPKDTNIHRASFAWRQSYIQYVQTWSRSNLCIPFSLYLHLTSGNLSWLLFFFDWICAILMKPLKCKELPLTAFVNNG